MSMHAAIDNTDFDPNDGECLLMKNNIKERLLLNKVKKFDYANDPVHSGMMGMVDGMMLISSKFLNQESFKFVAAHEEAHWLNYGLSPYWAEKRGVVSTYDALPRTGDFHALDFDCT